MHTIYVHEVGPRELITGLKVQAAQDSERSEAKSMLRGLMHEGRMK